MSYLWLKVFLSLVISPLSSSDDSYRVKLDYSVRNIIFDSVRYLIITKIKRYGRLFFIFSFNRSFIQK